MIVLSDADLPGDLLFRSRGALQGLQKPSKVLYRKLTSLTECDSVGLLVLLFWSSQTLLCVVFLSFENPTFVAFVNWGFYGL